MEVLTLHGYSCTSDEAPMIDGSASLHLSFPSLTDSSHGSLNSTNDASLADDASLIQTLQHCQASQCVDKASIGATAYPNSNVFNTNFMIPIQLGWDLEGKILEKYFGLAMAVCAVGLLRSACLSSESTINKFPKESTLSMVGKNAMGALELLMQRSSAEAKQEREIQEAVEHSTLLENIKQLQGELLEVKRLRSEDGKANERVVSIFASREQAWKAERRKFSDDQQLLCQELQRAYLQLEALNLKLEQPRNLQKQRCSECEHREGLLAELKERFGEQEFLIMATMEETQIEQQEKKTLAEKLASAESSLSQMQEKFIVEVEKYDVDLRKHKELDEQLRVKLKDTEIEHLQVSQELKATQTRLSTLIHEKTCCEEHIGKISTEITQLKQFVQGKDDIISAMRRKAKVDNEDRKELERELALVTAKFRDTEVEKEKLRQHVELSIRSSLKTENLRFRNSFGSRSVSSTTDIIEDMQNLHNVEIRNLQSTYEEQVQMLQKRLSLYQERVADLEEDILLHMTNAKRMITHMDHDSLNPGEVIDNQCMILLKDSMEAELATKQFQLSVAKTLIKQFMDLEAYREQEIENWKKLYLASKAANGIHKEKEQAGAVVPRNPGLPEHLELEKTRYMYKLEQRHWQVIDAFERQMKARDERMEAFRWQLIHMEGKVQTSHRQIEALKQSLANSIEENRRLEELLKQERDRCENKALGKCMKCACDEDHQGELFSLQEKISVLQALLTEKEIEYEQSLARTSAEAESELQDRECKLAVAEAQLVQAHIIFDKERKEKEKLLCELQKEKSALELYFNTSLSSETKNDYPAVTYKACLALRRLSTRIHNAQAQASPGDSQDEERVKKLVEQSLQCSNSYPDVAPIVEEQGSISEKSGKSYVSSMSLELVDDGLPVDKFVAEVQPRVMV